MHDQSDNNEDLLLDHLGLGYVGLPTSIYFAMNEFQVIGLMLTKKIVYLKE